MSLPVVVLKNIKNINVTVTTAKGIIGSVKSLLPKKNTKQIKVNEYIDESIKLVIQISSKKEIDRVKLGKVLDNLKMISYYNK